MFRIKSIILIVLFLFKDTKQVLNRGELDVQLHVSHVFVVVELTVLAKERSVTCVEVDECLHQHVCGEDGTVRLTEINVVMLLSLQLLHQVCQLLL